MTAWMRRSGLLEQFCVYKIVHSPQRRKGRKGNTSYVFRRTYCIHGLKQEFKVVQHVLNIPSTIQS
jgi:hypothetical protein